MTKRLKNEFDSFVCDILNNDKVKEVYLGNNFS